MSGIVYLLTNEAMPGFVKIGHTTQDDPQTRIDQLFKTNIPFPFDCKLAMEVKDEKKVEAALHQAFEANRVNPSREFFKIDIVKAEDLLRLMGKRDVTPKVKQSSVDAEDRKAVENYKKKRPVMNFIEMGIESGSVLHFTRGNETVTTIDDRRISYEDEQMSLTAVTTKLLNKGYDVQPSPYWSYKGRLLSDIYEATYTRTD